MDIVAEFGSKHICSYLGVEDEQASMRRNSQACHARPIYREKNGDSEDSVCLFS